MNQKLNLQSLANRIRTQLKIISNSSDISNFKSRAHLRGLECERLVSEKYVTFKGQNKIVLIESRWRSPFGEVDLIWLEEVSAFSCSEYQGPNNIQQKYKIILTEVKSLSDLDFLEVRITPNQKMRIEKISIFVTSVTNLMVDIHYAFVTTNNKIYFLG